MGNKLTIVVGLALAFSASAALATNAPCSGKKGGVVGCQNGKFMCKDGTISASKQVCTGTGTAAGASATAPAPSKGTASSAPNAVAAPPKGAGTAAITPQTTMKPPKGTAMPNTGTATITPQPK